MKLGKADKWLLYYVIIISLFGIIMIYSSSYVWAEYKFNSPYKFAINQGIFFLIGIGIMNIVSKIDYKLYHKNSNKLLFGGIILLICVLIPGLGTVRNGSRSWFGVGSFGIQPSEFMKLILIIFTSKYMAKHEKLMKSIKKGALPILAITLLVFILIMLQPDFGTGIIIIITTIALLFVGGVPFNFFIRIGISGLLGVIGLIAVAPYRISRILSFLNPWKDPLGSGFQIIQSLYAIGPGGLFGQGFMNSRQKHFYLPEPQTDFIFAIISEEFGFLGVLIVSGLFILILTKCFKISKNTNDLFAKYLVFGISFQMGFQAILNLMVVTGLIPVTGITLPFLSYGGSSLLVSLISIGVILNVSRYNKL